MPPPSNQSSNNTHTHTAHLCSKAVELITASKTVRGEIKSLVVSVQARKTEAHEKITSTIAKHVQEARAEKVQYSINYMLFDVKYLGKYYTINHCVVFLPGSLQCTTASDKMAERGNGNKSNYCLHPIRLLKNHLVLSSGPVVLCSLVVSFSAARHSLGAGPSAEGSKLLQSSETQRGTCSGNGHGTHLREIQVIDMLFVWDV